MEEIGTPSFKDFKPTNTPPMDWNNVINKELPADLIDLLEKIFVYISFFEQYLSSWFLNSPKRRITALDALQHPYFDELRAEEFGLPNNDVYPDLFTFTPEGIY